MKRSMMWIFAAILLLAISGLANAQPIHGILDPGDYVITAISNPNDAPCRSEMRCWIPTMAPIPHITWVTHGTSLEYLHSVDLSYGQSSASIGGINYSTATLHWYVGTATANGFSEFIFIW